MSKWNIEFKIVNMDIMGNCADVRLDVDYTLDKKIFGETQFLHLLRDEDGWLIYNKIYTYYDLPRD